MAIKVGENWKKTNSNDKMSFFKYLECMNYVILFVLFYHNIMFVFYR